MCDVSINEVNHIVMFQFVVGVFLSFQGIGLIAGVGACSLHVLLDGDASGDECSLWYFPSQLTIHITSLIQFQVRLL